MFGPLEVCSQAYKLQMFPFKCLACTDSSYETMQDRGIGNEIKSYYNDLTTILKNFWKSNIVLTTLQLPINTLYDISCTDSMKPCKIEE